MKYSRHMLFKSVFLISEFRRHGQEIQLGTESAFQRGEIPARWLKSGETKGRKGGHGRSSEQGGRPGARGGRSRDSDAHRENRASLASASRPQSPRPSVATFTICLAEGGRLCARSSGGRAGEDQSWVHADIPNRRGGDRVWGRRRQEGFSGPWTHTTRRARAQLHLHHGRPEAA